MSHIHDIGGYANAAAQYQEFLERLKASRLAERDQEIAEKAPVRDFDSAIDTQLDGEDSSEEEQAPEGEQGPSQQNEPRQGPDPENGHLQGYA